MANKVAKLESDEKNRLEAKIQTQDEECDINLDGELNREEFEEFLKSQIANTFVYVTQGLLITLEGIGFNQPSKRKFGKQSSSFEAHPTHESSDIDFSNFGSQSLDFEVDMNHLILLEVKSPSHIQDVDN
ncbi:Calcium-binding EF-hand [Artemisia annua]|uniref:Calcium-binding EF-hand n=1 Tax=Artemisia annua TaxID=35608 RepID=A0A2U1LUW4_ARTAN|nr:Calcium-binding EF-hand [Artemisia annua]